MDRADRGDKACLPQLRALFDDPARGPGLVEHFGGLTQATLAVACGQLAPQSLAIEHGLCRKVGKLRADLEGPNPSPLERLLCERVAFCWLMCYKAEVQALCVNKDASRWFREYSQRQVGRAHRRYLSACRTLATVRKLEVNVVVNLASVATQINVGAGEAGGDVAK